jgi:hypothetical protein
MIGGREGRNLRFQRFAFGGILALCLVRLLGTNLVGWIFWSVFMLTLIIEIVQERRHR